MVAKPEMLGRFIFNSDYPTDKVIWLYEGQASSPSVVWETKYVYIDVPSILGSDAMIFVKGAWTIDNWQTSHMIGSTYASITASPDKYIDVSLGWGIYDPDTDTNKTLYVDISTVGSLGKNKTVKYRLWGLQRDDIAMAIDYPKNTARMKNKLAFNTDNNYPRLFKDGVAKAGDVITHNLGHIPYMDYWYLFHDEGAQVEDYYYYYPMGELSNAATDCIQATEKVVRFLSSQPDDMFYYRIYA